MLHLALADRDRRSLYILRPRGRHVPMDPAMNEPNDIRRKRLKFRCWHRGTREADFLLGRFADRHLDGFGGPELDQFEALIERSDPDIYNWLSGREPLPQEHRNSVTAMLTDFTFHQTKP